MTDRLEEVLEQLEDEQEDREVLTLAQAGLPFPGQPGTDSEYTAAPEGVRSDGAADLSGATRPAEAQERLRALWRGEAALEEARAAGWIDRTSGGSRVLWPAEGAGQSRDRGNREETWLAASAAGQAGAGVPGAGVRPGQDSVLELYRQVSRAAGAAGTNTAAVQAVTVTEQRAAPAAGLTVGELDRAVRRDSRRYDGGMTLY